MTTLAAIQGPSWVVVGYDSLVSDEGRTYTLPKDAGKCVRNGDYLLAVAGDFRVVNILSHSFTPPAVAAGRGVDLDKFMISKFVPSLKRCFDTNFYGKDGQQDSLVLVVVNAVAYEIGGNYDCIRDQHGLYALGSGSDFALGALHALDAAREGRRSMASAREHMDFAMKAAASLDSGTAEPVIITTDRWKE